MSARVSRSDRGAIASVSSVAAQTTFIRYMLERDFPGCHVGPEPTTDRFMAVMHGKDERTIPGNAAAADMSKPFTALTKFGMAFLNKFEVCQSTNQTQRWATRGRLGRGG